MMFLLLSRSLMALSLDLSSAYILNDNFSHNIYAAPTVYFQKSEQSLIIPSIMVHYLIANPLNQFGNQLREYNGISPDISAENLAGFLRFEYPLVTFSDEMNALHIYVGLGLGFSQTEEDLKTMQKEGSPQAKSTKNQTHFTNIYSLRGLYATDNNLGYTFSLTQNNYVETVDGTTLEDKNHLKLSVGLNYTFGEKS